MPKKAKKVALIEISSALVAKAFVPRIGLILPLELMAQGHETVEGGSVNGRVFLRVID